MQFKVKILKEDGTDEEKIIEAPNKVALYDVIRQDGGKLVSAKEVTGSFLNIIYHRINSMLGRVGQQEIVMFSRNISAMLKAGLSLSRALSVMEHQTKNEKFKKILGDVNEEIKKGGNFSTGLAKYQSIFSVLFVSMVKAGEESGNLGDTLGVIADQMEKTYLLKKKIKGAMIYPAVILSAMIIIGVLMMIYVVPSLTGTFKELKVELPPTTKVIIGISDFLQNHTILFLFIVFGVIFGIVSASKTTPGKRMIDYITPRFPVLGGIVQEANAARTARTLSSLLSAGVEVVGALSITKDVLQNSYYKEVIDEAQAQIQKGAPMSAVFMDHEEIYPILVGEMISVGEETGALSDMLSRLAIFYETEVDQKTKDLSTIIEPFLMLFIGGAVGFFAIAMISPTYSIMNNI